MDNEILITIDDCEGLERIKDYMSNPDFNYVSFDTETTGLDESAEVIGFSIACEDEIGIYVVLAEWQPQMIKEPCGKCASVKAGKVCKKCDGTGQVKKLSGTLIRNEELKEKSKEVLEMLKAKSLIMHNAIYDCKMINRDFGIELMPYVHTDTMILAHLLNENESCGLKEIAARLFGESSKAESVAMKESVIKNGGTWKATTKEIYKADKALLAKYGAKDTILTLKIFKALIPQLFEENLDKFFYEDESMPLLRGPTYQLNTVGLKVDVARLKQLEKELNDECTRLKYEILDEIKPYIKDEYPGTSPATTFNINSSSQMAWLLFIKLKNDFNKLTDAGRALAKELVGRVPYNAAAKREFVRAIKDNRAALTHELEYAKDLAQKKHIQKQINKMVPEKYMKCDKDALVGFVKKYGWVGKLLKHNASKKLLTTYCKSIYEKSHYGVIRPNFLQHGTTSGRYSSSGPNFQNLPRDDKRIKECIVSRPGRSFVGADESQIEARVFASTSQDPKLMKCFERGEDFYSVVGIPIFKDFTYLPFKEGERSWATAFKNKRQIAKAFALATPYGTTAFQQSDKLRDEEGNNLPPEQCQDIIDAYFAAYPAVKRMMIESHEMVKRDGAVYNLFGRPRRIPEAKQLVRIYGPDVKHEDLHYSERTYFNLAMNHRVQSTAASIMNRAAIAFYNKINELGLDAKIVLQVHDSLIIECPDEIAKQVAVILQDCMENAVKLPGVKLEAKPTISKVYADQK